MATETWFEKISKNKGVGTVVLGWVVAQYVDWNMALRIFGLTYLAFIVWCFSVYFRVFTKGETEKGTEKSVNFPQLVREPLEGKTFKDYDYTTDYSESNIWFMMWLMQSSPLIAPYETLIYELSEDDLLNAQEINHAIIQTAWNKYLEKATGYPVWSFWQVKVYKKIMFDYFRPLGVTLNLMVGVALEALFCWIAYYYCMFNGGVYYTLGPKSWIWGFHMLEEIEHTHLSVPEMRVGLPWYLRLATWFVFDIFVVVPILVIIVPVETIRTFPKRVFCLQGFHDLLMYILFVITIVPFSAMGQFGELVLCLDWKTSHLEELWNSWHDFVYVRDGCEGMFRMAIPKPCNKKIRGKRHSLKKKGGQMWREVVVDKKKVDTFYDTSTHTRYYPSPTLKGECEDSIKEVWDKTKKEHEMAELDLTRRTSMSAGAPDKKRA